MVLWHPGTRIAPRRRGRRSCLAAHLTNATALTTAARPGQVGVAAKVSLCNATLMALLPLLYHTQGVP